MRLSIICCTWNSAKYLPESIRSVLSQDYSDIEYVFVDGGSTDGTLDQIAAIPQPVKLLRNIRGGISRAMNAGIEIATGDVIAHLHSDDYYVHHKVLSSVVKAFEESGAKWLFGRCLSDVGGKRISENYVVPRYDYRRLLKGNFIPHPATFIRRDLFQRAGLFDESIKYAMDYDLWLRLAKISPPLQINEHLAVFRWHAGSLTASNRLASLRDDFSVRLRHARRDPWSLAYHWAHYLVRRQRLVRQLSNSRSQS